MEVFIQNLEPKSTSDDLKRWLIPILTRLDIRVYDLRKHHRKPHASLTVLETNKAQSLIEIAKTDPAIPRGHPRGKAIRLVPGRHAPDRYLLKHLHHREHEELARKSGPSILKVGDKASVSEQQGSVDLDICLIECGRWEAKADTLIFMPYSQLMGYGTLSRSGRVLQASMHNKESSTLTTFKFDFTNIHAVQIPSSQSESSVVVTLTVAPKMFTTSASALKSQPTNVDLTTDDPMELMLRELMSQVTFDLDDPVTYRVGTFSQSDTAGPGTCFVYSFQLTAPHAAASLRRQVKSIVPRHMPISKSPFTRQYSQTDLLSSRVADIWAAARTVGFDFAIRFQIEALWANAVLSPGEVVHLMNEMCTIFKDRKAAGLLAALHFLHVRLLAASPLVRCSSTGPQGALKHLVESGKVQNIGSNIRADDGQVRIHRVLVTPAGIYLYGPDKEAPNRILRQYPGFEHHFLRVAFADENGDRIQFSSDYSNELIFHKRFLEVLQQGITVADEKFDFLGFSHSSLRSQSCWFMRPFTYQGSFLTARIVIQRVGNFANIRCPAKCAARIGQAFSDTQRAVKIDPRHVVTVGDVTRGRYTFTDGCGTISQAVCNRLVPKRYVAYEPTLYQIRYKGAKGMISLDTTLRGSQMRLRNSMVKFDGSPSDEIEICGVNTRPLPLRLNRSFIKILEDLGVPFDAFFNLQTIAVDGLRQSAQSAQSAIEFLSHHLSDGPFSIFELARALRSIDIDMVEDSFIRDVLRALIEIQLREIKFRSRIPVPQGVTLYGISDETGLLKEGQVFVTFTDKAGENVCLNGRVAVTRSPALHPGDIQVAIAIEPCHDSILYSLTNCVVFSQKGERDLPSMLGGGDLDGDLFNVIYDNSLVPRRVEKPAEYAASDPVDIGREVNVDDMTKFFIEFMESDQLGRIATLHQVYADQKAEGTFSAECLELASLHSCAVDFSKTGIPVNHKEIPRSPPTRPDFMAPSTSTRIERDQEAAEAEAEQKAAGSGQYRYYPSKQVLGKLYRAINEDEFFNDLEGDDDSIFGREGTGNVMEQIWAYVHENASHLPWKKYLATAQDVHNYYDTTMTDIMHGYTIGDNPLLTEKEVFIGTIIGRTGASNGRQREQSEMMKAKYHREVRDIRQWMKEQTEEDDDIDGYLCLAIACLSLCVKPTQPVSSGMRENDDELRSFGWFAATICVPKLMTSLDEGWN